MGRKCFFNLIEIAVALAVAAIGVTAIMALLPVAIKSSSDAVGDTIAADAANTIIAIVDKAMLTSEGFESVKTGLPTAKKDITSRTVDNSSVDMGSNAYVTVPADAPITEGKFKIYFGPQGEQSDFGAEVRVWQESPSSLKVSTPENPTGLNVNSENIPLIRVYIEVSWPLSRPYYSTGSKSRQVRLFVREYMDPAYQI